MADSVRVDIANKNRIWKDAIECEMKYICMEFELYKSDPTNLKSY